MRRAAAVTVAAALLLTACGGSSDAPSVETSPSPTATASPTTQVLQLGKSELTLTAGAVRSPDGFAPAVELDVPAGWTSSHRYADAFDVGRADPSADAPLVVLAVTTAPEPDAAAALKAVAERQRGADLTRGTGDLLGSPARSLEVVGGDGPAYASRDGSIALDAVPGYRLRLLATDIGGAAVVVAVLVVDDERTEGLFAQADTLVGSLRATDES
jgi:hypothetical protein